MFDTRMAGEVFLFQHILVDQQADSYAPGSFISPITLNEPGVISRNASIYSGFPKDRREDPIWADRYFVLKGLSPGISRR